MVMRAYLGGLALLLLSEPRRCSLDLRRVNRLPPLQHHLWHVPETGKQQPQDDKIMRERGNTEGAGGCPWDMCVCENNKDVQPGTVWGQQARKTRGQAIESSTRCGEGAEAWACAENTSSHRKNTQKQGGRSGGGGEGSGGRGSRHIRKATAQTHHQREPRAFPACEGARRPPTHSHSCYRAGR